MNPGYVPRAATTVASNTICENIDITRDSENELMMVQDSPPIEHEKRFYHCDDHIEEVRQSVDVTESRMLAKELIN